MRFEYVSLVTAEVAQDENWTRSIFFSQCLGETRDGITFATGCASIHDTDPIVVMYVRGQKARKNSM